MFSRFSFVESGATIAGAFQFSDKQGPRVCRSAEKKCLARRLRSEARGKSWEEHDAADQTAWWSRQRDAIQEFTRQTPVSDGAQRTESARREGQSFCHSAAPGSRGEGKSSNPRTNDVTASRHQAINSLNCTPSRLSRASSATCRNQEFCATMSPSDRQLLSAWTSPVKSGHRQLDRSFPKNAKRKWLRLLAVTMSRHPKTWLARGHTHMPLISADGTRGAYFVVLEAR